MIRLVFADLAATLRIWGGMLLVAVAVGAVSTVPACYAQTGAQNVNDEQTLIRQLPGVPADLSPAQRQALVEIVQQLYYSLAGIVIVLTLVAGAVVVASTANLTVELGRRGYALWQIAGIAPWRISAVVRVQILVVSGVGAALGAAAMTPVVAPLARWGLTGISGLPDVPLAYDWRGAVAVIVVVVAAALAGSTVPAHRAGRVPAIEALRGASARRSGMHWWRWLTAVIVVVVVVRIILATTELDADALQRSATVLFGVLWIPVLLLVGPALIPAATRAWTAVVPPTASSSWYLARATVLLQTSRASASVLTVVVAAVMPATVAGTGRTIERAATGTSSDLSIASLALLFGGPVIAAVVGGVASIWMSSVVRDRELALVRAAGAPDPVTLRTAVWESVMLVGTGALVSIGTLAVHGLAMALVLTPRFGWPGVDLGLPEALPVLGASFVLMVLATTVPTVASLRRRLTEALQPA